MSRVRHVHARRGEYVRVHRSRGDGGSGTLILFLLGGAAVVLFIISYLETIIWLGTLAMIGYGIIRFRKAVWKFICWSAKLIWRVLTLIVQGILYVAGKWKALFCSKEPPQLPPEHYGKGSPNYGKIVQNHN